MGRCLSILTSLLPGEWGESILFLLAKPGWSVALVDMVLHDVTQISGTSFRLPANCRKVSTRAFLLFLEQKGWIESATDIERRRTILAGRAFSRLRFPPS